MLPRAVLRVSLAAAVLGFCTGAAGAGCFIKVTSGDMYAYYDLGFILGPQGGRFLPPKWGPFKDHPKILQVTTKHYRMSDFAQVSRECKKLGELARRLADEANKPHRFTVTTKLTNCNIDGAPAAKKAALIAQIRRFCTDGGD